jgi:hypothetical protein
MAYKDCNRCKTVYYQSFADCKTDLNDLLDVEAFDGVVGRSDLGLVVDSRRFTQSVPQGPLGRLDYYKFLACVDKSFPLSDRKDTTFKTWISGRQYFNAEQPLPDIYNDDRVDIANIYSDPRLASSGFLLIDDKTDLFFGVVLTDKTIYGLYGRGEMSYLRQQVLSGLLSDFFNGNGDTANVSLASMLGLDVEPNINSNSLAQVALLSGINPSELAYLNSLGNFRLLCNGLKGWDLDKCRKKKCRKVKRCQTDYCGIDASTLLSTVNQASHLNFIPLGSVCGSFGNLIKAEITFRLGDNAVDWIINGNKVYTLDNIGSLPLPRYRGVRLRGEVRCDLKPCSMRFCFGTFTFLDSVMPGSINSSLDVLGRHIGVDAQEVIQEAVDAVLAQIPGSTPVAVADIFDHTAAHALVPLAPVESYIYPVENRLGEEYLPPFFFVTGAELDPQGARLFGQGAALIIRDLEVYECDSRVNMLYHELSCNKPAIDLIDDGCCETSESSCDTTSSIVCFKKVKCKDPCKIKKIEHKSHRDCDEKKRKDDCHQKKHDKHRKNDCGC